ncbi:YeiH family protein [Thalassovita sp.]|uniref:YeiH family protein n=1 Tax=Thalassovita sp. TaxID=1979401 RepID=UPI002881B6B6|nr:putative sulfate exporter family transporter [Thalassovita sp.]MDF1803315.1 putative sulfate exporter family transporter [Thalassovita sp.]
MSTAPLRPTMDGLRQVLPGMGVSIIICLAALALGQRYGAPVMPFALLLGIAMSFLAEDPRIRPGLEFTSSGLLKIGVALLGLSISTETFSRLGIWAVLTVIGLLILTILLGIWIGRRAGWPTPVATVAAGAVSICGASAALAISSLLPGMKEQRSQTMTIVLTATALSTLGMVAYPVLLETAGFTPEQEGFVLGASIHDVAQVVGAGYSVSDEVGEIAVLTKMIRVAMLPVVLLTLSVIAARNSQTRGAIRLPWFVLAFIALAVLASFAPIPEPVTTAVSHLSRSIFYVAIAAIGLLSNVQEIFRTGHRALAVLGASTLFLLLSSMGMAALLY